MNYFLICVYIDNAEKTQNTEMLHSQGNSDIKWDLPFSIEEMKINFFSQI